MWVMGRQNDSGYHKWLLFKTSFMDCYLLRFKKGSYIASHTDPVSSGKNHHRLNVILKRAQRGGDFICNNIPTNKRINKFRPDIDTHSVTKISKGTRYVLSIGWVTKGRTNISRGTWLRKKDTFVYVSSDIYIEPKGVSGNRCNTIIYHPLFPPRKHYFHIDHTVSYDIVDSESIPDNIKVRHITMTLGDDHDW